MLFISELATPEAPLAVICTSGDPGRGRRLKGLEFLAQFLKKRRERETHKTQKHSFPLGSFTWKCKSTDGGPGLDGAGAGVRRSGGPQDPPAPPRPPHAPAGLPS